MSQRAESPEAVRLGLLEKIDSIRDDLDFLDEVFNTSNEFQNEDKKSAESILDSMREPLNEIKSEIKSEYKMIKNGTLQIDNHYSKNRDINSINKRLDDFKKATNSLCKVAFDNPKRVYIHLNEKEKLDNYLSKLDNLKKLIITPELEDYRKNAEATTNFNENNNIRRGIKLRESVKPLRAVQNSKSGKEKNKSSKEETK